MIQIRMITYNIHRAIGLDRRFRPDRIEQIIREHDPEIVLLQEVDEGVPRSNEQDMAKEMANNLSYPYYAVGHNVSLRKGRYGNATLSRYPIIRERNIDLTVGKRKRRGCQHTTIQVKNDENTHLLLEVFNLHLGLSVLERQRQAGIILRSKEFGELKTNTACIVAGDFNDWLSRLRVLFVEGLSLQCATDYTSKNKIKALKTFPSFSPQGGLDRVYYNNGLTLISAQKCRDPLSRIASDHLPVVVDFSFAT